MVRRDGRSVILEDFHKHPVDWYAVHGVESLAR